jgi:hypothetical protein
MGMTVIKGAMNAGITGMGAMIMDGVGGIVGMTGSMTAAMTVGTMGVVDDLRRKPKTALLKKRGHSAP